MQPTPYVDLNAVLREMTGAMREVLADRLVGVYLQGSFAVGDFALHGDVDWIAVVEGEPAGGEVEALQVAHGRLHDLPIRWAKHLEGSYFPREVLRDPAWAGLIDRSWARRTNAANWIGLPADPEDWEGTLDFVRYAMERARSWAAEAARDGLLPADLDPARDAAADRTLSLTPAAGSSDESKGTE